MSQENKEFYELLNELVNEQTFDLELTNGTVVKCKQLTTAQLKELIKAVVDSPLTQSQFNSTASKIFQESLISIPETELTVIDRLLFLIDTRIQTMSPTTTVTHEEKEVVVDFAKVKEKLLQKLKQHSDLLKPKTVSLDKINLVACIPSIETDTQLCEEIYKNSNLNVEDVNQLRKIIGDAFVNEIAKTVKTVSLNEKTLEFSTVTFKSRLKTIESLPASLIQSVIDYIESYKKIIDECLVIEGYTIPIDGSLFSVRR